MSHALKGNYPARSTCNWFIWALKNTSTLQKQEIHRNPFSFSFIVEIYGDTSFLLVMIDSVLWNLLVFVKAGASFVFSLSPVIPADWLNTAVYECVCEDHPPKRSPWSSKIRVLLRSITSNHASASQHTSNLWSDLNVVICLQPCSWQSKEWSIIIMTRSTLNAK